MRGCRCVRMQRALRVMLREHNPCRCACVLLFLLLHSPLHGLYLLAHTPSRFELFTVSLILQWPLLGYLCFPGFIFRAVRPAPPPAAAAAPAYALCQSRTRESPAQRHAQRRVA